MLGEAGIVASFHWVFQLPAGADPSVQYPEAKPGPTEVAETVTGAFEFGVCIPLEAGLVEVAG
jgi:hypothetical protein